MKSREQQIFDEVLKNGCADILKKKGFKKKAANFYLFENGIGKIVNVQKSRYNSASEITFTINTGIFLPEFWLAYYDFTRKKIVPDFPSEPESIVRKRVSELKGSKQDIWYQINEKTNEEKLIDEVRSDVTDHILPYFEAFRSKEDILSYARKNKILDAPLGKLILFAEFGFGKEAQQEFDSLKEGANKFFLETLKEYAQRYQLKY